MSDPAFYNVGWICALSTELVAAREFLDDEHDPPEFISQHDNNTYILDPPTTEYVFTDFYVSDNARLQSGYSHPLPRPIERIDFASSTTRLIYRAPREIIEAIRIVPRLALVLSLTL